MHQADAQTQVRQRGQPRRLFLKDGSPAPGAHRSPRECVYRRTLGCLCSRTAFRTSPCALQVRMVLTTIARSTSTPRSRRSRRRPPNRADSPGPRDFRRVRLWTARLRISLTSWAPTFAAGSALFGPCSTRPRPRQSSLRACSLDVFLYLCLASVRCSPRDLPMLRSDSQRAANWEFPPVPPDVAVYWDQNSRSGNWAHVTTNAVARRLDAASQLL